MDLYEYQARDLFEKHTVPVLKGAVATTPEAARDAWLKCKLELADQLKPDMDAIDPRIYNNVVAIIKAAI